MCLSLCPFVTLSHRKTHVFPGRFLPKEVAEGIHQHMLAFSSLMYFLLLCDYKRRKLLSDSTFYLFLSILYSILFSYSSIYSRCSLLVREPASAPATLLHPCISKAKKPARIFAGFLCRSTSALHRLGKSPPAYLRAFSGARKGYKGEGRLGTTATMAMNPLARSPLGDAPK